MYVPLLFKHTIAREYAEPANITLVAALVRPSILLDAELTVVVTVPPVLLNTIRAPSNPAAAVGRVIVILAVGAKQ